MLSPSFTHAPLTRLLVTATILLALAASLTDTKPYLPLAIRPHILDYGQYWRLLIWQAAYLNSTEVLFAGVGFYNMRVVERLWGSRKFGSFLLSTLPYTTLLPPLILFLLRPLSPNLLNYLPSGPTAILFALLAQYHAAIPHVYKYRVSSPFHNQNHNRGQNQNRGQEQREYGLDLTSKSTTYILPLQLALAQLPGSAIAAGVGWLVGFAYRREILPGAARWRVPVWVVGGTEQKERYDNLRRRMEGEAGRATGVEGANGANGGDQGVRRRGMVGGLVDQFRGAF